jgi:hypothetical protein
MPPDVHDRPERRFDRLFAWMRASKWRQWLVLYPLVMILTLIVILLWIAVAYMLGSTERNAGAVALNYVLIGFIATVGLFVMHPALYRWYWHLDRRQGANGSSASTLPAYGSEPTEPAPNIDWPWSYRLRHGLVRLFGTVALLVFFMPYGNQRAIAQFISAYSGGRASAGSLAALMIFYLPFGLIMALIMLLTWRQMKRHDAGQLSERESLLLNAELIWLFSFGATLLTAIFLCHFAGTMIIAFVS